MYAYYKQMYTCMCACRFVCVIALFLTILWQTQNLALRTYIFVYIYSLESIILRQPNYCYRDYQTTWQQYCDYMDPVSRHWYTNCLNKSVKL